MDADYKLRGGQPEEIGLQVEMVGMKPKPPEGVPKFASEHDSLDCDRALAGSTKYFLVL